MKLKTTSPKCTRYDKAMVLAKDVEGWEMGKIQAFLSNKILSRYYREMGTVQAFLSNKMSSEDFDKYFERADEHTVVPFDGVVPDAIIASAEKDGIVLCSVEWNASKLSLTEMNAIGIYD